jgi:MFS family permease
VPSPNRLENLQTLRAANADGALATAFATLVGGAFLTGFIALLGGSDYLINLVSAVPALLGLLQIPGGIWGRSFPSYKRFIAPGGLAWRLCYLPLAALPVIAAPSHLKLIVMIVCICVGSACVVIVNPIYNEWLANLVPATSRGFFFSRRNATMTAVGASIGLIGGLVLDAFKRADKQETGFSVVFAMGGICALGSMLAFLRMRDSERPDPQKVSVKTAAADLKAPFADKRFRKVLIFLSAFIFGQALPGNLFAAYAIKSIDLSYTIILWAGLMQAMGNVIASRFWGFLADKYGNRPVLTIVGFGLAVTPAMWLFVKPHADLYNALVLLPCHVLVGCTWAGVSLCQYNILLTTTSSENRGNYLSSALAVQSVIGFISPMAGAQLFYMFDRSVPAIEAYRWVFGSTMVLRFLAVWFLIPVREEGASEIRQTLRDLTRVTPRGLRAMRKMSTGDVAIREQAIESVAAQGASVAGDEVIKALHDPSPRVRRQAASALAKLNDPNATEALIHVVEEHPDLVEEEIIEALGHLGSPLAVDPLVRLLKSPRALTRRTAAKALAQVGDARAIQPLIEAAATPGDPDLRRASVQALRQLGASEADEVIADALFDPMPSVRIAAAEAVAELELESALPYVRQSLNYYSDEAESEVAYALGVIGTAQDVPQILIEAGHCVSIITRRRCLLGVARVLGVESDTYRLMLLEGMARDHAIMAMLKPHLKGSKRLRDALALYSSGNEIEALKQLAPNKRYPEFTAFAERPVEELFLVAAALVAR